MKSLSKKPLPTATIERIIKNAGAKRVSKKAAEAMAEVLYDYVFKLAKEAAMLAEHAGRKTIVASDVKLARKRLESH